MGCFWSCLDPHDTEAGRPYGGHTTTVRQSVSVNSQDSSIGWYERRQQHLRFLEQIHLREVSRQPSTNLENRLSARSTGTTSTQSQSVVRVVPRIDTTNIKQRQSRTTSVVRQGAESDAKFGQYKCTCGRRWESRLCWPDKYQKCKYCKKPVYPYTYRDLKPTDHANGDTKLPEHDMKLCQMCEQLGYSCLVYKKNEKHKRSQSVPRVGRRYNYDSD